MKALINYEIAEDFTHVTGIESIPLMPYNRLDLPVSAHADMLFCILDKTVFCYEDYVKEQRIYNSLVECGLNVVFVSNACNKDYPNDVSLNVLIMGKTLFCNEKYVAREILAYAKAHKYKVVNIKQGYAACSTLVIDENNAITSDFGIAEAIKRENKSVLVIKNDEIILKGYNCGFIGGATGVCGKKIFTFGDLNTLVDGDKIFNNILECKSTIVPILSGRVYDFGGIKLI